MIRFKIQTTMCRSFFPSVRAKLAEQVTYICYVLLIRGAFSNIRMIIDNAERFNHANLNIGRVARRLSHVASGYSCITACHVGSPRTNQGSPLSKSCTCNTAC